MSTPGDWTTKVTNRGVETDHEWDTNTRMAGMFVVLNELKNPGDMNQSESGLESDCPSPCGREEKTMLRKNRSP